MSPFRSITVGLTACFVLCAANAAASTLSEPAIKNGYKLQQVGAGQLNFLGRPVYAASLWTSAGSFEGFAPGEPVALSLHYQRDFSRDELLKITATAWRLMGSVPPEQRERWLASLRGFWSNVGPGDNVTTVVIPGRFTRFYNHREFMGQVDDPAFGPSFLAIWLDPRSVVGDLRVQLLGAERTAASR
jgi:hypothetical protein